MLTKIDGPMLAEAFPTEHFPAAMIAGRHTARLLAPKQWTERFAVQVACQTILIPARLHFESDRLALTAMDDEWRFARALQTRSNDGFERQRALRDLLEYPPTWAAPFILTLVGEYIIEILQDISNAMTPEMEQTLSAFIVQNKAFWNTIKSRVASYWNVYYRPNLREGYSEGRRAYGRHDYVGFELVDRLEMAAFGRAKS